MAWSRKPDRTIYARTRTTSGRLTPIHKLTSGADINGSATALASDPGTVSWFDRRHGQSLLRTATFDDEGAITAQTLILRTHTFADAPTVLAGLSQTQYLSGTRILRLPLGR